MLAKLLILWLVRLRAFRRRIVTFETGDLLFWRYEPFWHDEWIDRSGEHYFRPPWWRPFNVLLHCWNTRNIDEEMHDHPRWSVTICLRGQMIEKTPWGERLLKPGSIVIRSRKAIHGFKAAPNFTGRTWTLFIVGRRNHRQNTYAITSH